MTEFHLNSFSTSYTKPSSKNNILILHGTTDLYGGSKILSIVAEFLNKEYNVTVVLSECGGPLEDLLKEKGVEVLTIRLGILRRKYFTPIGLLNRIRTIREAKISLTAIVREKNIKLIYSNTTAVLVGAYLAQTCNIKHVWHVHEIIQKPRLFSNFIGWHMKKFTDKVIVVSNEVKKHWQKYVAPENIQTIYNGIDYDKFIHAEDGLREELNISDDEILIGMIGRVNMWKGQKYFLEMASIVNKLYPKTKFLMVGDVFPGYEFLYDEVEKFIIEKGLEKSVINLGYRTDIPYIQKAIDIFVLPSILPDPLPTVILEAMGAANPVVGTAHGGALEMIVNEKTGFLIPWNDAEKAAEKLCYLIQNPDKKELMGLAARKHAFANFSLDSFKENVSQCVASLLEQE